MQDIHRWENGSPVTFQMFTNINYGKDPIYYDCDKSKFLPSRKHEKFCSKMRELSIKLEAETHIYPLKNREQICTLMALSNLAEPNWVSISCFSDKLLHVVCVKSQSPKHHSLSSSSSYRYIPNPTTFYPKMCLKIDRSCYQFVWKKYGSGRKEVSFIYNKQIGINQVKALFKVFNAVYKYCCFPPLIVVTAAQTHIFRFVIHENNLQQRSIITNSSKEDGYYIFHSSEKQFNL